MQLAPKAYRKHTDITNLPFKVGYLKKYYRYRNSFQVNYQFKSNL